MTFGGRRLQLMTRRLLSCRDCPIRRAKGNSMHSLEARSRSGIRFRVEWRLPSDPAFLPVVRGAVEKLCAVFGWTESEVRSITLAVDEALTNVNSACPTISDRTG